MVWTLLACHSQEPIPAPQIEVVEDSDEDAEAKLFDTGFMHITWQTQVDNSFTGLTEFEMYSYIHDKTLCRYCWDTTGVEALSSCEACDFAWEYSHSNGRSPDLEACAAEVGLSEDHPLPNNKRGFASAWTSQYTGTTYEDVLMQYFGSPYNAWYGVAYADYSDGVLSYTTYSNYYY